MAGTKGRSGRRRKPKELKELEGTDRPDRDPPGVDVPTGDYVGEKPPGLHSDASKEWDRITPLARSLGLLTDADWLAWRMGFFVYSQALKAMDYLGERDIEQWSTVADSGYRQSGPEVTYLKQYWSQTMQFCREFGLTASARSGLDINTGTKTPDDPTESFLN